jgi:protein-disulfide isomerase
MTAALIFFAGSPTGGPAFFFCARGEVAAGPASSGHGEVALGVDQAREVTLAPPAPLPFLGPRYAPVTLDAFIPVGARAGENNLNLALRLARESADVRLVLHPVTTSPLAERGAEVIWEACAELPGACFGFVSQLYAHPDWLAATTDGEAALLGAAAAAGLDAARLRRALLGHRHRPLVSALWQSVREQILYPPDLWINGRRLRGTLSELQLREELDRQRARAQRALQGGARLTQLYEQLLAEEAALRLDDVPRRAGSLWSLPSRTISGSGSGAAVVHLLLDGAPSRGPKVAPVTIVLIASVDSYEFYSVARAAYDAWQRHADSARLVFLQAARGESSERTAVRLAQLALIDQDGFWRLFDRIVELSVRRFLVDRAYVENLLRSDEHYPALAAGLYLDEARRRVQQDREQVRRIGIENTPLVLVNGLPVHGSPLADKLDSALQREAQRGLLQRLHAPPARIDYGWLER